MVNVRGDIVSKPKTNLREEALKTDVKARFNIRKKHLNKEKLQKEKFQNSFLNRRSYERYLKNLIIKGDMERDRAGELISNYPFSGAPTYFSKGYYKEVMDLKERYKQLAIKSRYVDRKTNLVEYKYSPKLLELEKKAMELGLFSDDFLSVDNSLKLIREDRRAYSNRKFITKEEQERRKAASIKEKSKAKIRKQRQKFQEETLKEALKSPKRFIKGEDAERKRRMQIETLIKMGKIDPYANN